MSPAGSGHIINMASALSKTTFAGAGLYVTSKYAVGGLTRNTAVEYGESGIRINAICPGFIETPLLRESIPEEDRAHLPAAPDESAGHPRRRRQSRHVAGERCVELRHRHAVLGRRWLDGDLSPLTGRTLDP